MGEGRQKLQTAFKFQIILKWTVGFFRWGLETISVLLHFLVHSFLVLFQAPILPHKLFDPGLDSDV